MNRVQGARGWLDLRESILRLTERKREPWWAHAIWSMQYLWKVRRAEVTCSVIGHRWTRDGLGIVCRRCARGPTEV